MSIKGIDVSVHQGVIDFNSLKSDSNVGFAMIRAGYRGWGDGSLNVDANFDVNYTGFTSIGVPVGAYFFSQAKSYAEGKEEADFLINHLLGKKFQYPICIDSELSGASGNVGRADNISVNERTQALIGFCKTIENAGYYAMIYCSASWLDSKLNSAELSGYDKWIAKWSLIKPAASYGTGIWQNSNNGSIKGIKGRVDTDISYRDYPSIMNSSFLNGYVKPIDKYDVSITDITNGDKVKFEQLAQALNIKAISVNKK